MSMEAERAKVLSTAKKDYETGIKNFRDGKFDDAEKSLGSAIRPFLSKPAMKSAVVDVKDFATALLSSMYYLGTIYINSNQYFDNFSKVAAIFQYCAKFADKHKVKIKENGTDNDLNHDDFLSMAYSCESKFLDTLRLSGVVATKVIDEGKTADDYKKYREDLTTIREEVKSFLDSSNDIGIGSIADRTVGTNKIYGKVNSFLIDNKDGLLTRLLKSCFEALGPVPAGCEFAVISLGSLASGKITPWSDLEFAVLINEDIEEYKEYFRNLTKLLHIKIINLEETSVRSVGVEALNNFRTGEAKDEWFWDDVMDIAFKFDAAQHLACKTPLGRQGGYIVIEKSIDKDTGITLESTTKKRDFELIMTPEAMMKFQVDKSWYESDEHLVQSLRSTGLIVGDQTLLDNYRKELRKVDESDGRTLIKERSLEILARDLDNFSLKLGDEEEGKLMEVKKSIYRVVDRLIEALANYFGITAVKGEPQLTSWQIIERMEQADPSLLSPDGARHLREALSIGAELRLATYSRNKGQKEGISTYVPAVKHLTEDKKKELLEETFYLKNTQILHHFYYVILRVQNIAQTLCSTKIEDRTKAELELKTDILLDLTNHTKGLVHARFLEYKEAIKCLEEARHNTPQDLVLLNNLFTLYNKVGKIEAAVTLGEAALKLVQGIEPQNSLNIAISYNNLGAAYQAKGEYKNAIKQHEEALKIKREYFGSNSNQPAIADSYNNLGNAYYAQGEYDNAIKQHKKALKIEREYFGSNSNHFAIAGSYNNLGDAYQANGKYHNAIKQHNKALKKQLEYYRSNPNHPDIAMSYNNLGAAYQAIGEYDKAIEQYDKVLKMRLVYYSATPNHPDIAMSYNNLGSVYASNGQYYEAIKEYEEALRIQHECYGVNSRHPDIAMSYNNLGNTYRVIEEFNKAEGHNTKALEVQQNCFGEDANHPDIADSHTILGAIYAGKEEYTIEIEQHKQALAIRRACFRSNPNHPDIAESYNNLGSAYKDQGDLENARDNFKEALRIQRECYWMNPNHPDIAKSYYNLGSTYQDEGDLENSINNFEIALAIRRACFKSNPNHPDIADSCNSLGIAHQSKGVHCKAEEYHNEALTIRLICFASNLNHTDIAASYNNLGSVHFSIGNFDLALECYKKASDIFKLYPNEQRISIANTNYISSLFQLGIKFLLEADLEKARKYFCEVSEEYQYLNFDSSRFIELLLERIDHLYQSNTLKACIACQNALVEVDPELKLGNHYHNLARYYAVEGDINLANDTFRQALKSVQSAGLHASYAQFLIVNRDQLLEGANALFTLETLVAEVRAHLYFVVRNDERDDSGLEYGKLEERSICKILADMVLHTQSNITINPKLLAYYLLLKHPEYLAPGENMPRVPDNFRELCDRNYDEVSLRLLSDAYQASGNSELATWYQKAADLLVRVDKVFSFPEQSLEVELEQIACDKETIRAIVPKLEEAAWEAVKGKKLQTAAQAYSRILNIYNAILKEESLSSDEGIPRSKQILDNLATIALLSNNIELFSKLKLNSAEINRELAEIVGAPLDLVLQADQKIKEQLLQQQIQILGDEQQGRGHTEYDESSNDASHNQSMAQASEELQLSGAETDI